jgi:hypothetical protein
MGKCRTFAFEHGILPLPPIIAQTIENTGDGRRGLAQTTENSGVVGEVGNLMELEETTAVREEIGGKQRASCAGWRVEVHQ